MQTHLDEVQEAALRFLDVALAANDKAFLISFDSSAKLVATTTGDKQLLRQSLLRLLPNGYTALHDATPRAATARPASPSGRGAATCRSTSSRRNWKRATSCVPRASGGRVYELSDISKLNAIYDAIAEALRAQMLVTIRTAGGAEQQEWREIKVDVNVRAPAGYYAPR